MQGRNIVIGVLVALLIVVGVGSYLLQGSQQSENSQLISEQAQEIEQLKNERGASQDLETTIQDLRQTLQTRENEVKQQEELITGLQEKEVQMKMLQDELDRKQQDAIISNLQTEINRGDIEIQQLDNRTIIRLESQVLFASGETSIRPEGVEILSKIGETLKQFEDQHIQVEGHTDNFPVKSGDLKAKYETNWELSAARSVGVLRYLIDQVGVDPRRISAAGYGKYQPKVDNSSESNRQANRRVEFVLLPKKIWK